MVQGGGESKHGNPALACIDRYLDAARVRETWTLLPQCIADKQLVLYETDEDEVLKSLSKTTKARRAALIVCTVDIPAVLMQ